LCSIVIGAYLACVWLLQHQFHDRVAQLVYTFPEDATTSTGTLFWSAPKRFPHALDFDASDPTHAMFVQAAAILKAQTYGLVVPAWANDAMQVHFEHELKVHEGLGGVLLNGCAGKEDTREKNSFGGACRLQSLRQRWGSRPSCRSEGCG
jgi:Ubiquitin-activating enzyme active site